jgi:hypothetical protein
MPQPILHILEEHLNNLLMVESRHKYTISPNDWMSPAILTKAKHHQNIIDWDNFLRGYISKLWTNYNNTNDNFKGTNKWHDKLIPLMMKLHRKIWNGEAVNNKVKLIYQKPPKLAPRYQSILNTPLKQCLKHTTNQLNVWLHRLENQQHVSDIFLSTLPPGQITLRNAYER